MNTIPLPSSFEIQSQADNRATLVITPCYPGYGTTLGNALRRVLLSSLEGAAIKAVKINGVQHEFTAIDHVKEDVVGILLNLKTIRFQSSSPDDVQLKLKVKGEKKVTAGDIEANAEVQMVNKKQLIATLTDKNAVLEMDLTVGKGRGYDPVESREADQLPLGFIAVDSIFTPIRRVNFTTENVRVGQMTNYEKLHLDIETDGTLSPVEAFKQAVNVLVAQFGWLEQQIDTEIGNTSLVDPKGNKGEVDSEKTEDKEE